MTGSCFVGCALLAHPSDWGDELAAHGVTVFNRPEALYAALRNRSFLPRVCIVDLDSVPRNLVKAVDLRVPCAKVWTGKAAAEPEDIKNPGVYYSKVRVDELDRVLCRLIELERTILLPIGITGRQLLPLLVADEDYRDKLNNYTDLYARSNLITLHSDDPIERQLVAEYLAVESGRARIWQVKTSDSMQSVLRKISQARRPGSDVTIILSEQVEVEAAREFSKSLPREYSLIKLSTRTDNPLDDRSFTLPRPMERPQDVENWITWFLCRASIDQGVALAGLPDLPTGIMENLNDNPTIEEIRRACDTAVKRYASAMEANQHEDFVSYEDLIANYERSVLRQALDRNGWNLSATARSLGLAESSLRYKLNKLGVPKSQSD